MAKAKSTQTAPTLAAVTLLAIVQAGAAGTYAPAEQLADFQAQGLVEVNPDLTDEKGAVAVRATQAGIDSVNGNGVHVEDKPAVVKVDRKAQFAIEDSVPVPTDANRGGRTGMFFYPFDELQVNQSFFVPNDEKKEDAAKSLASTVSAANKRFSKPSADGAQTTNRKGATVPVMVAERKFMVRPDTKDGVKGARVWRTM